MERRAITAPARHVSERAVVLPSRAALLALLLAAAMLLVLASAASAQFALWLAAPADAPGHRAIVPVLHRGVPAANPVWPSYASPAAGTTGTTALPPEPVAVAEPAPVAGPGTIVAARPFSTARASGADRGRALECLTAAIYYEAASEPDDGQRAVAQVVLNRVRHPVFPASVCGVVYQGSERSGCQFSFACDGAMARVPSRSGWARAARIAAAALGGYVFAPVGLATHYHTYAVTPAWNRTLVMTDAIGAHFFHRWKGYWGTSAAFVQPYRGAEPVPGPHQRIVSAVVVAPLAGVPAVPITPVDRTAVAAAITPTNAVQPAYQSSGEALAAPKTPPAALPESQVLDRWKDSGKPLR